MAGTAPLPDYYVAGTQVTLEEDRAHEFKETTKTADVVGRILHLSPVSPPLVLVLIYPDSVWSLFF
jgi:hypothetical protein